MTSAQVCILISIAVYLIAMLAIGIVCSKRNNTVAIWAAVGWGRWLLP